jgi:acetoin utilization deacetylase AcuC-like enzyme
MTDAGFTQLALRIERLAIRLDTPVIYSLEGGYNPAVVRDGIRSVLKAHTMPAEPAPPPAPTTQTTDLIRQARTSFAPFWKL